MSGIQQGLMASQYIIQSTGIIVDSISSYLSGSPTGTTATWAHTCSGSNKILIVTIPESRACNITSVTYNGVALTAGGSAASGNSRAFIYYLINPPNGTYDIVVTYSVSLTYRVTGAISLNGVHQSSPIGNNALIGGSTGTSYGVNLTTTSNGSYIIECHGDGGNTNTPQSGQTFILNGGNRCGTYDTTTTAGVYAQNWTANSTSSSTAHIALEIKPA